MMRRRASRLLVIFSLLSAQAGWAVPPFNPKDYPNPPRDHIHVPSAAKVRAAGSFRAATIATSTGQKNVAVIIVQFPAGCGSCTSPNRLIQNVGTIKSNFDNMKAYYQEVSYGDGATTGLIL